MLTEDQRKKRRLGIGGSDAAAVSGKDKYKTALEVYLNKIGHEIALTPEQEEYFYWGNILEPLILKKYEQRMGEISLPLNEDTQQFFKEHHEIYTWMRANIDGYILNKNIVIECKTARYKDNTWGMPGTDEMPDNYLLQCAHYAIVYDAKRVDLAVLFGSNNFQIYHYYRNKLLEDKLIEKEREFWHENVLKQAPPPPTNLYESMLLWPNSFPNTKTVTNETYMDIYKLEGIKEKISNLEKQADSLKLRIQQEMGENDTLVDANGQPLITWKTQITKRLNQNVFKKNYPHLHAQHQEEIKNRVFRSHIKKIKETMPEEELICP